jgi:hypothetical protein
MFPSPRSSPLTTAKGNEVGFEWILMDLMPGVSAYKRWRKMSMAERHGLSNKSPSSKANFSVIASRAPNSGPSARSLPAT